MKRMTTEQMVEAIRVIVGERSDDGKREGGGMDRLIVGGEVYDLTPEIAEGLFSCYQNLKSKHGRRKRRYGHKALCEAEWIRAHGLAHRIDRLEKKTEKWRGAMNTQQMIDAIRQIVARCDDGESAALDALLEEAEHWRMRRDELEAECED